MPPKRKRETVKAKAKENSGRKLVQNVPGIPPYFANFVDIEPSDVGRSFMFTANMPKKYGTVTLIAKLNGFVPPTIEMGEPYFNHPFYVVTDAHIVNNTFNVPAGSKVEYPSVFKLAGRPLKLKSVDYFKLNADVEVLLPSSKWKVQEVWDVDAHSIVGIPQIGALPENVKKSIIKSIYGNSAKHTHRHMRPHGSAPVFGPHPNIHVPSTSGLFTNMMNF